jgi:ABC-2 type transport system permease protein
MRSWPVVRLIAARELRTRARTRAFLIGTLIILGVALAVAIVPSVVNDDSRPTYDVGLVGGVDAAAIRAGARAADVGVRTRSIPDAAAATAALRDGSIDLAVSGGTLEVHRPLSDASSGLSRLAATVSALLGQRRAVAAAGLDPAQIREVLGARPLPVRAVAPPETSREGRSLAFAGLLLLYIALLTYGSWVLNGIIEEKSSRVVEVLLSAVRPTQLLTGKTLGIGLLGLAQLAVVGVPAAVVAVSLGTAELPEASVGGVAAIVLWFVLGFAFYCVAFAAAGSLVSRQEDAQSAAGPLTVLVLVAFFAAISALDDPSSRLAHVLSFVPPTAPLVMLVRTAQGAVGAGELVASLVVMAVSTALLMWAAAQVYTGAILRTGPRMKVAQAWRAARDETRAADAR